MKKDEIEELINETRSVETGYIKNYIYSEKSSQIFSDKRIEEEYGEFLVLNFEKKEKYNHLIFSSTKTSLMFFVRSYADIDSCEIYASLNPDIIIEMAKNRENIN